MAKSSTDFRSRIRMKWHWHVCGNGFVKLCSKFYGSISKRVRKISITKHFLRLECECHIPYTIHTFIIIESWNSISYNTIFIIKFHVMLAHRRIFHISGIVEPIGTDLFMHKLNYFVLNVFVRFGIFRQNKSFFLLHTDISFGVFVLWIFFTIFFFSVLFYIA